jgi:hypothetical protein
LKKILKYIILVVLVFNLAACGQSGAGSGDMQSSEPSQDQQDSNTLLYAGGDDLDSFLSEFDEKYFGYIKENLTYVELTKGESECGIHIYASGISMDDAKAQMEETFGITFEENDGALLFNDTDTGTVYILDVSDDGIYIRYDFFGKDFNSEIDSRDYFSVIESTVPEMSADAVEVVKAFYHDANGGSGMYIAYEYPEDKLSEIWDDYQQKLGEFDNYELIEEGGSKGVVYLDNGLMIETSVDEGWGRMYVTLLKAVEE